MRHPPNAKKGLIERPAFRMWGAPYSGYLTLAFLAFVLFTMAFSPTGRWVLASVGLLAPLLVAGWFACRGRIAAAVAARVTDERPDPGAPELAPADQVAG